MTLRGGDPLAQRKMVPLFSYAVDFLLTSFLTGCILQLNQ